MIGHLYPKADDEPKSLYTYTTVVRDPKRYLALQHCIFLYCHRKSLTCFIKQPEWALLVQKD